MRSRYRERREDGFVGQGSLCRWAHRVRRIPFMAEWRGAGGAAFRPALEGRGKASKQASKQAFNTDFTEKKVKPRIYTESFILF